MGKPKSVENSRRDKFGRSAVLSSFLSNFTKVFYCTAPKLPAPSFRCLKCKRLCFLYMWLLHWLLDLDSSLSKFILFSLANYNGSISKRGKYLFLQGLAHFHITYSSSLLQDLFNSFFTVSLENNYPWREDKKCLLSLYFTLWYWVAFI